MYSEMRSSKKTIILIFNNEQCILYKNKKQGKESRVIEIYLFILFHTFSSLCLLLQMLPERIVPSSLFHLVYQGLSIVSMRKFNSELSLLSVPLFALSKCRQDNEQRWLVAEIDQSFATAKFGSSLVVVSAYVRRRVCKGALGKTIHEMTFFIYTIYILMKYERIYFNHLS